MDRRTYRPTQAQRDWLILHHGTCSRDGCTGLAVDADLDHGRPWANGGTTDLSQLRPLCPRDHTLRHRIRYRTRPDRAAQVMPHDVLLFTVCPRPAPGGPPSRR
ncbi:HNH endonuclease signature motif containing protein [Microbacterium sp. NPDC089987]|uniref:HNH endonuclease signature motif containing protein n=1 Tax=Microbacterium sp. NPDC089987 TaxID=3364202 RepID=UPI003812E60E